ncbi:cyclophilin-like fold protein [Dialister sp.]|uniref:cyclophilin-like fold protein n=1 Tax=Dialister sp. TaxID=1955814 RepID=UPI003EFDA101
MLKKFWICLPLLSSLLLLPGCGSEMPAASAPVEARETGQGEMMQQNSTSVMTLTAGGRQYKAVMENNPSVAALAGKLPVTLSMKELNGNEKFYRFSEQFPSRDKAVGEIHKGDIMLYDSSYVVVFYKDFPTSYRYTPLGHIENPEGLEEALGSGNVDIHWQK